MKPVMQTKFGGGEGNCLMACVASIVERPLEELPEPLPADMITDSECWKWFFDTMRSLGYEVRFHDDVANPPKGYSIAGGPAARGLEHACVALDGEIVHDPHPDNTGLLSIRDYTLLIPLSGKE